MRSYKRLLATEGLAYARDDDRVRAYRHVRQNAFIPEDALIIGTNPRTGVPVYFTPAEANTHLHICGGSGKGKSFLLRVLVEELFRHHDRTGEGIGIIDPHGTLAEFALDCAVARGLAFAEKTIYVDFRREHKIPIFNPLRVDRLEPEAVLYAARRFVEAITKVWGGDKTSEHPVTSQGLRKAAAALIYSGLSIAEAEFFTENNGTCQAVRAHLVRRLENPRLRAYWEKVNDLTSVKDQDFYTSPAERRFDDLLESPTLHRMMGQNRPGIDLKRVMDQGGIYILNAAREGTNLTQEQQAFVCSLHMQEFRNATEQRAPDVSRPFTLIADEFGEFTSGDAMRIFTGARKFGLRCVFAHQDLHQLLLKDNDFRLHAAVLAIENKIVFGGGPTDDALQLARELYANYIDTESRKLELWSRGFAPETRKVTLTGSNWSERKSRSRCTSTGATTGTGSAAERGNEDDDKIMDSVHEGASSSSDEAEGSDSSYGENEHEQYVTFFNEFKQLSSVQFRAVEEQIFRHMQELHRQPRQHCTIVAGIRDEAPSSCRVGSPKQEPSTAVAREQFLRRVEEQTLYIERELADRLLSERRTKLLAEAGFTTTARGSVRVEQPRFAPKLAKGAAPTVGDGKTSGKKRAAPKNKS